MSGNPAANLTPSATNGAIDMDPDSTTRQVWTDTFTSQPVPADASTEWKDRFTKNQTLMKALFDHPAMEPNRQQTFGTPAKNKNKVYFSWDFVGRTLVSPLATITPQMRGLPIERSYADTFRHSGTSTARP